MHPTPQMEDFTVTCPLVPNASRLISGFCSSPRSFGLGFLQTPPRSDALALLLAFGSAIPGHRTFTDEVTRHARRTRRSHRRCAALSRSVRVDCRVRRICHGAISSSRDASASNAPSPFTYRGPFGVLTANALLPVFRTLKPCKFRAVMIS